MISSVKRGRTYSSPNTKMFVFEAEAVRKSIVLKQCRSVW